MRANIGKGIAAGLVGGLFASWAMIKSHKLLNLARKKAEEAVPPLEHALEWRPSGVAISGEQAPATINAAVTIASKVLGRELAEEQQGTARDAVHYAFGTLLGGVYGAIAEYLPQATAGMGSLFALALWSFSDEVAVPLAGWANPPQDYPIGVHVSALAAHVVFGVSTELVRSSLRQGVLAR